MIQLQKYLNRRLTARETAIVVVVVSGLAAIGSGASLFIIAKIQQERVNAAFPKVCYQIREERGKLASAIEAQPLVVDPATNTLFYELAGSAPGAAGKPRNAPCTVGTVYNPTNNMYSAGGTEAAEEKYVKGCFRVDGFKNCGESQEKITNFLKRRVFTSPTAPR